MGKTSNDIPSACPAHLAERISHRYTRGMIPILHLENESERARVESLLSALRLDPAEVALNEGVRAQQAAAVQAILADVA